MDFLQHRSSMQEAFNKEVLSPLCFSILRSIMSSSLISGFTFPRSIYSGLTKLARPSPPVKALAYADGVIVFLKGPTELQVLLQLVSLYGRASNAKPNCHKTLAVSLSGQEQLEWRTMFNSIVYFNDMTTRNPLLPYNWDIRLQAVYSKCPTILTVSLQKLNSMLIS
ncbi:hypothetical protein G6F37_008998 [Rhizopus arrhizus]|nr:hypothetical protein G6F38_009024 [Rhizopus arrhizus]KAG1154932.1 hypothetical protein G6F37_008998 [Rhizopus arrhizus]